MAKHLLASFTLPETIRDPLSSCQSAESANYLEIAYSSISCVAMHAAVSSPLRHNWFPITWCHLTKHPRLSPVLCAPHSSSGESLGTRLVSSLSTPTFVSVAAWKLGEGGRKSGCKWHDGTCHNVTNMTSQTCLVTQELCSYLPMFSSNAPRLKNCSFI